MSQKRWSRTADKNSYQRRYLPPAEVEFVKDLVVLIDVVSIITQCVNCCILSTGVVPGTERCLIIRVDKC